MVHTLRAPAQALPRRSAVSTLSTSLLLLVASSAFAAAQQFLPPSTTHIGRDVRAVASGDFNGDGILDLAVGHDTQNPEQGRVSVLLGNGDGSLRPSGVFPTGGGEPSALVARDFNGDGHLDLAVANYGGGGKPSIAILFGDGAGGFSAPKVYLPEGQSLPSDLVARDFNHDGFLDLAVVENGSGVSIFLGDGTGKLRAAGTYPADGTPTNLTVADFNGDGDLDLAVSNTNSNDISILLGNGDGSFQPAKNVAAGLQPESLRSRDLNGDGVPDLVVVNINSNFGNVVQVLLGVGDGTFQPAVSYPVSGFEPKDIAVADFNGDGNLDLAVATLGSGGAKEKGVVSLLLGNGDGTFGAPTSYTTGKGPASILAADFNGDGCLDLATGNFFGNSASILLNTRTACKKKPSAASAARPETLDSDTN